MENKPEYIQQALDLGYDVEIDVWLIDGNFFLGHDEPQYQVHGTFLMKKGLWCHAKNIDAFYLMSLDNRIHCFSHDRDEVALTSRGYFWSSSENEMTSKSICVMPSDYIDLPKNIFLFKTVIYLMCCLFRIGRVITKLESNVIKFT